jgi:peptide/nickel transport system substrate-binding protein
MWSNKRRTKVKSARKLNLLAALTLVVALVLAACGGGEDATSTPEPAAPEATQAPEATMAPEPTEPPPPTEAPEPEEESSVVIAIPEDPPSFNGIVTDTGYEQMAMKLVLLGMAGVDPNGEVYTELAAELPTQENGDVVVDEDEWTMDVTWKMRDDIVWADGEPVTADDVIFTWEKMSDEVGGIWSPGSDYTDSVEKIDDYTFVVHYNTVYPGYLTQFGGEQVAIWPEHYCDAEQDFVDWDCGRDPLSSGPYVLEEWVEGDHLTLARNPNYYEEGRPHIDNVIIRIVPEQPVRKTMMAEGDADLNFWLDEPTMEDIKDEPNVELAFSPYNRWVMRLIPNEAEKGYIDSEEHPHPFFKDVRVRRAVRMAVDVDTLVNDIFLGYSEPVWTEFFRPPYECDNIPRPEYNPEQAAALLEEAGWTDEDGDGIRECHGCEYAEEGTVMSTEFVIYSDYGESLELAQQLIAEDLKAIGMDTELSMMEGGIMWADYGAGGTEQNGEFELNMWDDGYAGVDPSDFIWTFYHTDAQEPDWGWNVVRWSNEEADALIDETYTLDEEYRQELFCQLAEIFEEELPWILLFSTTENAAHSTRLQGVQPSINDIVTWNAEDWEIQE